MPILEWSLARYEVTIAQCEPSRKSTRLTGDMYQYHSVRGRMRLYIALGNSDIEKILYSHVLCCDGVFKYSHMFLSSESMKKIYAYMSNQSA